MIVVVRHGRTAANASGLLQGRIDPPLDAEGERQAAALASSVPAVSRVVTSPLQRAVQTARCIADAVGADVEVDDRWIELDYGSLDGTAIADVPADDWARWRADVRFRPAGGETLLELGERVRSACADLAAADTGAGERGGDVVVVAHVSPIKAAVAWALGVGDEATWRMYVAPASITRIVVRGGVPLLHSFNEVAHLG